MQKTGFVLVFFSVRFRKDNIGVEGETLHGVAFVLQIGVCRIKCKVQNAKCKMSELRCDYNKTNLEHCRGRSLCLPVIDRKPCGRARRPDPTLQRVWCIDNIPTISKLVKSFYRRKCFCFSIFNQSRLDTLFIFV